MNFQEYLITNGYIPYVYDCKSKTYKEVLVSNTSFFSTMSSLDYRYIKDGDIDNQIIYGLWEYGKPPTLCHRLLSTEWNKELTNQENTDRFIRTHTNKEILNKINEQRIKEGTR